MRSKLLKASIRARSLEQQADEMSKYSASLAPVERLQYLKNLIQVAYGKRAKEPVNWIAPIKPGKPFTIN
jgi:hypothetical protein